MKTFTKIIILITALLNLGACDSSYIYLIRIDTVNLDEAIHLTDKNSNALIEIKTIVNDVCSQFKLKNISENNEIKYTRYWGSSNYRHPNSLYLSLGQNDTDKHILEISIFEWETIKQTEFGKKFQSHLLKELKELVPEQEITLENL